MSTRRPRDCKVLGPSSRRQPRRTAESGVEAPTLLAYALTISVLLALGAWLLDRGVGRLGAPTRWTWLGALLLGTGKPPGGAPDPAQRLARHDRLERPPRPRPRLGRLTDVARPRDGPVDRGCVACRVGADGYVSRPTSEEHVRTKDPLTLALGLAAVVVAPWNPLAWWQHRRLRDAVEVDCDRRVLSEGRNRAEPHSHASRSPRLDLAALTLLVAACATEPRHLRRDGGATQSLDTSEPRQPPNSSSRSMSSVRPPSPAVHRRVSATG